ncbi:MAG TPA: hypothetical protein VLD58_06880, partial [Gemmatimonadales bacterium]|nr:hypothetical protein [Gemmatimonadales bacterium]
MSNLPPHRRRGDLTAATAAGYQTEIPPSTLAQSAVCLLIDDDADVRQAMAHVLEAMGLSCIQASSGAEA